MKTYIIQFWRDGVMNNITDKYGKNIEFTSCTGAREIASNLIFSPRYPQDIKDSEGWCQMVAI